MFLAACCEQPDGQWIDIYGDPVRPRRTGFECPLDVLQVLAWGVIALLIFLHFMLHVPFLNDPSFTVVLVIATVLFVIVIGLKLALSLRRVEDPNIFPKHLPRLEQVELTQEAAPEGTEPCVFCRRFVLAGCKHCGVCDKCVPGFDHHCRWLNSCVGSDNYRMFCAFIGTTWCGISFIFAVGMYIIVDALQYRYKYERILMLRYKSASYEAYIFFLFVTAALCLAGMFVMGKLIAFHIRLCCTHKTTYQHMVEKRQRRREEREAKGELPSQSEKDRSFCACMSIRKRRDFRKYKKRKMAAAAAAAAASAAAADAPGDNLNNSKKNGEDDSGVMFYSASNFKANTAHSSHHSESIDHEPISDVEPYSK